MGTDLPAIEQRPPLAAPGCACILDVPYLLALDTPVFRDGDGRYWADASWARDLAGHMTYLPKLTMLGIVMDGPPPPAAVPLPERGTRFVAVRSAYGRSRFYRALPRLIALLLRETRRATIVHSSVAYSDALPYGWFAFPIAWAMRRKTVVTIEGSFWRLFPGERAGRKRRIEAWMSERINRFILRHVDYASYQHEEYRRSLPAPRANGGVLAQASWVAASDVIDQAALEAGWAARVAATRRPRAIFAGRLMPEKGTRILAAAIDLLAAAGTDVDLHIIGSGEDRDLLAALDGRALGHGRVTVHDPIPYGPDFFGFLREFDMLLVPSLADEQPRIVYDAGAQGVGAIVSDTPGLRSCVLEGETAIVVPRNDPRVLADAIRALCADMSMLRGLGRAARDHALAHTHERMHEERCRDLQALLARDTPAQ